MNKVEMLTILQSVILMVVSLLLLVENHRVKELNATINELEQECLEELNNDR